MSLDKLTLKLARRRLPFCSLAQRPWEEKRTARWIAAGRPIPPPPSRERQTLREHGKRCSLPVLVETGTFLGDPINSLKNDF